MSSMQVPSDRGDRGDPVLPRGGGRGLARGGKYVRPAPARCPTRVGCGEEEEFRKTNLQNKGLISADRGTKATLVRTIPRSLFKSYTKDLLFPIFELVFQHRLRLLWWSPSAVTML